MDLQPENCAKCGSLPEDILMLTCNHDLCLTCAAKNLQREMAKYGDRTKSIMCELCGAPTILDESSIEELLKVPTDQRQQEQSTRRYSPQKYNSGYQSPPNESKPNRATSTKFNATHEINRFVGNDHLVPERPTSYGTERKSVRGFCLEHPDEEISYFCFDCLSNCVCPECVIHGHHRNHDVMTVKKAHPLVKAKIDELLGGLSSKIEEERLLEEKCETHKKEVKENNRYLKTQVAELFTELRNRLDKKEKEILNNLDLAVEEGVKDINSLSKSLENKAAALSATYDLINNHIAARDEVLLLNFYANNQTKISQQITSEDFNFKKLGDNFKFKTIGNFTDIIDSLNLLQVQVSAVGNVSFDKFQNEAPSYSQNYSSQNISQGPQKYLSNNINTVNRPTITDIQERYAQQQPKQNFNSRSATPGDQRKGYEQFDENQGSNPYQKNALGNIYKEVKGGSNFRNFVNLNKPADFKGGMTFSNHESNI